MSASFDDTVEHLWSHLVGERQAWLLGAGISINAGVPPMAALTGYVDAKVREDQDATMYGLLGRVRNQLPPSHHIEHVLNQLVDFMAIADRTVAGQVDVAGQMVSANDLRALHQVLLDNIGFAVKHGYKAPANGNPEVRGCPANPIVTVDDHLDFVMQLFRARSGRRVPGVRFFTVNYDTLLEDALALARVPFVDGFRGGAFAFWDPRVYDEESPAATSRVFKIHGSVDWYRTDGQYVTRCRDGAAYPQKSGRLLIYPQANKYVATQRDPFATGMSWLRRTMAVEPNNVLVTCGYSFGDEHINAEIESAMEQPDSRTVLVALVNDTFGANGAPTLAEPLNEWLGERPWRDRIYVMSSSGLYHASVNCMTTPRPLNWWTFQGLTQYLRSGKPA